QNARRFGHHFLPDAVAGNENDVHDTSVWLVACSALCRGLLVEWIPCIALLNFKGDNFKIKEL
ncbi:MAG: hypothetical protein D6802_07310, partial [Ardenticatenia bacterium]